MTHVATTFKTMMDWMWCINGLSFIKPLLSIKEMKCSPGLHHLEPPPCSILVTSLFAWNSFQSLCCSLRLFACDTLIFCVLCTESLTFFSWTHEWSGLQRRAGWFLMWRPPATTGSSTQEEIWVCSWLLTAQTVSVTSRTAGPENKGNTVPATT